LDHCMAWWSDPAGVGEHGVSIPGSPGTWEFLSSPCRQKLVRGYQSQKLQASSRRRACGNEHRRAAWYRQAKQNEARRNGRQEVGALHSTVEAGEQQPSEPCGGKGVPSHGPVGGKHARRFVAFQRVHETPADSGVGLRGWSIPPACGIIRGRRAVCLNWASTDLREARRVTAGLTRPNLANLTANAPVGSPCG